MQATPPRPRSRLIYLAPFIGIAVLLAFMGVIVARRVAELRSTTEGVVYDAMTDVLLMARMGRDLDQVRLLTDEHVFEKGAEAMAALEGRIAGAQDDYDAAADEFESMPVLPEEQTWWNDLKAALRDIQPRLASVLAMSRRNDDEAARHELVGVEGLFVRAANDLRSLSTLNAQSAKDAVPRVAALQRSSELYLALLATLGAGLAITVGLVVTRALQTRERMMRDYAERLEASNRDLDAFAGRVAHDLRSPLTTATLTTSWLSRNAPEGEHQKKLEVLKRSFGRMDGIIQDLLALSRIMPDAPTTLCDPAAATEQLRDELTSRANQSSVSLTIDMQAATVHCSEGLLRQVVWNLADNAMKYRRADVAPHVEICGRACGQTYELAVRDNGIGISHEEATMVFDPFYRASGGRREPGTGLGLSIVKRAVEANGGKISVTSEPGNGSEFVAKLPLA
jgi:two-component system, OmpR family, sensor kinase